MDIEADIRARLTPRRVPPAGLRYDLIGKLTQTFYRDLDPESAIALDPKHVVDRAIRAETESLVSAIRGLGRVVVVGVNPGWPALRIASVVGELVVLHPHLDPVRLARTLGREKWHRMNIRWVVGGTASLPLADGSVDAVVSDFGLASWKDPGEIASELVRVLKPEGRLAAREANWGFELQGRARVEESGFKRHGGRIYYGYTKRTLDPPREVEYICLLDHEDGWVQNLRALPREALGRLSPEDCPQLGDLLVSAEYFEIAQMTAESLARLLAGSGLDLVRVVPSGLDRAVREHHEEFRRKLGSQGYTELADALIGHWEGLTSGRTPILLAKAVKPG